MKLMHFLKHLAVWVAHRVFQLELVMWVTIVTLVMLAGSAAPIKQALDTSKLYDRTVDVILDQSKNVSNQGAISLDDQTVRNLIKDVFSGEQIRGYSEDFIDGTYQWLEGKSPEPTFRIDLSAARQTIAVGVANKAAERLATLPTCTKIPTGQLDPFAIECLPPGINIEREKQRVINEMLANKDFLPETAITAAQLPKSSDGKTFVEANKNVPKTFQLLLQLPYIIGSLAIVTAAIIIWLANDKRRGIRSVGRMILGTGGSIFGVTLLFGFALPSLSSNFQARFVSGSAAPLLGEVLTSVTKLMAKTVLISSGSLVILSAVILLAERFIKPAKSPEPVSETTEEKATPEEPAKDLLQNKP